MIFLIIGAIVFGIYYFGIASPAANALATSKTSALSQVSSLNSIGTSKAVSDASSFTTRIQAAGSQTDVDSISSEVSSAIQREQARKDLLTAVSTITTGDYYSATGSSGTTAVQALVDLETALTSGVNSQNSLSEIDAYESTMDTQATATWRSVLENIINSATDTRMSMTIGIPPIGSFISTDNALLYVDNTSLTWQDLRALKLEDATVQVPVKDTYERTPTLAVGSVIRVYIYDMDTDNLALKFTNAIVRQVVYSYSDLGSISWTSTTDTGGVSTTASYTTNIWETIKAAAAGNADAANVGWNAYVSDVMTRAMQAGVGNYSAQVLYVVEVSDPIGEEIVKAEFQNTDSKDVILVPIV